MKCKYFDDGWCCAPIDVVTSASSCGSCNYPEHCPYLKTEMTNQQPEVMSSGTAIISDENGVPTKVHLSDKEKLTEMTEKMDSVKSIEAQIKMLQSKLEFYKEVEKTPPSSVEEAYKKVFGCYPQTDVGDGYWEYFQNGYKQAQKDYKVGENQEPEDNEWKSVALRFGEELVSVGPCGYYDFTAGEWLEWTLNECKKEEQEVEPSMTNCVITGNPPNGYVTWQEWYNELGSKGILHNLRISSIEYEVREWDVVREIMNWCKEHPGQNPLDWVKPKTPEQVNPFVPKELEELVKEGVKQKDDYPYK